LGIQHPQFCERAAHLHASQDAPPKFDHGCWEKSPLVHKRAPSRRNSASVPERRLPQHAGPSDFLGSVLSWRHTADDARPVRAAIVHDSAAADLHSRIVIFENFYRSHKIYQANHPASLADRARIARSRQIQKPQAVPALERVRRLHRIDPAVISVHLIKFAGSDAKAKRAVIVLQMQSQTLAKHFATNAKPEKKN
jgi:hypothetical protein